MFTNVVPLHNVFLYEKPEANTLHRTSAEYKRHNEHI